MTFTGQFSKDLPDYELARSLGLASGGDINFTALAGQLDCSRNFSQAGIIYSDGTRQWLVRPSRRIATPNESSVSHVVITKVNAALVNPVQATTATINSPSLATEIGSTAISCGAAILTVVLAAGAGMAIPHCRVFRCYSRCDFSRWCSNWNSMCKWAWPTIVDCYES